MINPSRTAKSLVLMLLMGTAAMSSGCSMGLPYCVDDCIAGLRNEHLAKRAWLKRRSIYKETENCLCDFKTGFKDGYIAGIEGKAECPPALAPPKYWGVRYQSESGRCCVNAWHTGWAHGAIAADQDRVSNIGQIVVRCPCGTCHSGGVCPNGYPTHGQVMAPAEHIIESPMLYDSSSTSLGSTPPAPVPSLADPRGEAPGEFDRDEVPVYLPGIEDDVKGSDF